MADGICSFDGCANGGHIARGLCSGHYKQQLLGKPLRPLKQRANRGEVMAWLRDAIQRDTDECIVFPFAKHNGYGQIAIDGRPHNAHRVALNLVQPWHPPYGTYALHACDNPPCVNPAHLSWGTQQENVRQTWERGRGWSQVRSTS